MNQSRISGWVASLAIAAILGAACGDTDQSATTDEIAAIVDDLNAFWEVADDDLGFDYEPVPVDRVGTGDAGLTCSGVEIRADEVADNAFVDPSCDEGITVAYDPAYVGDSLARAEATMAHEWGHVIQAQAQELDLANDPNGLPIDSELQADCLAGAWAAERAEADIERLRRDTAKAGDEGDVDIEDPHAHGTPADRTAAFDVGLDGGPSACINELLDALPQ